MRRPDRMFRRSVGLASLICSILTAGAAHAVGDEERQLSAQIAYAHVRTDGQGLSGVLAELEGQYGLSDTWAARLALDSSWHPVERREARPGGLARVSSLVLGITYAVDVLRLVPFVDAGIGLVDIGGAVVEARRDLGVQIGLGLEYLLTRDWAAALLLRYQYYPVRLGDSPSGLEGEPTRGSIGVRLGRIF